MLFISKYNKKSNNNVSVINYYKNISYTAMAGPFPGPHIEVCKLIIYLNVRQDLRLLSTEPVC